VLELGWTVAAASQKPLVSAVASYGSLALKRKAAGLIDRTRAPICEFCRVALCADTEGNCSG
jgi:hypothetical protein